MRYLIESLKGIWGAIGYPHSLTNSRLTYGNDFGAGSICRLHLARVTVQSACGSARACFFHCCIYR